MIGGLPLSWASAWKELAWCHHRAHKPKSTDVQITLSPNKDNSAGAAPTQKPMQTMDRVPIALANGVTGRSNPLKEKKKAKDKVDRTAAVATMPEHIDGGVRTGQLVFISVDLQYAEGELAVGLARAMESCKEGEGECKFMWFVRNEWCKKDRQHQWSKTPTFRVAADPNNPARPYVTKEPLHKVLPLEVVTTKKSIKKDLPRLDSGCVKMVRELCMQRGLVCPCPQPKLDDEDGVPKNGPDQRHREGAPNQSSMNERVADRVLARKRARHQVVLDVSDEDTSECSDGAQ